MAPAAVMMPWPRLEGPRPLARQPNELDHRRIRRAIEGRRRYRYVTPRVLAAEGGYRIVSPNCSRNIDPHGGEIDIALIHYAQSVGLWRLFYRDHRAGQWCIAGEAPQLAPLLAELSADPARRFWP